MTANLGLPEDLRSPANYGQMSRESVDVSQLDFCDSKFMLTPAWPLLEISIFASMKPASTDDVLNSNHSWPREVVLTEVAEPAANEPLDQYVH